MKNKVLLLADPDSIHTEKWCDGWKHLNYIPIISGISKVQKSDLIIKENFNSLGGNGFVFLKNIFQFRAILSKIDPVILNAHFLTSYGLVSALIKRKKDFLVLSIHGTDIMRNMDKNLIYLIMAKYIFYKSDIIISVSVLMTKKILKYFPNLKDKILTQQYGVDIKLLDKYRSDIKDIDILTNRQWKPNSNYPTILEALSTLSTKNIKLIGAYDDEYSQNLLDKYNNLKIYSTGLVPYEKNLNYVSKSKLFISLTSSDGIALSLVEAIYFGAIPIVSNIVANKELIVDGVNGFLIDINSKDLKEKIEYVLNLDANILEAMKEYNKKLVLEKFDFEKNFTNLDKLLKEKVINAK